MIIVAKMTKLRFYMTTKRDLRTSKSVTSSDSESLLEAFLPEPIVPQDTAEKSTEFKPKEPEQEDNIGLLGASGLENWEEVIITEDISDNIVFGQTIDSSTVSLDASDTVVFGPATGSPTPSMLNDTIPYQEIRIQIGSTLETIMKHFDDPVILNADIVFQRITPVEK